MTTTVKVSSAKTHNDGFEWKNIRVVEGTGFIRALRHILNSKLADMVPTLCSHMTTEPKAWLVPASTVRHGQDVLGENKLPRRLWSRLQPALRTSAMPLVLSSAVYSRACSSEMGSWFGNEAEPEPVKTGARVSTQDTACLRRFLVSRQYR